MVSAQVELAQALVKPHPPIIPAFVAFTVLQLPPIMNEPQQLLQIKLQSPPIIVVKFAPVLLQNPPMMMEKSAPQHIVLQQPP
jgi:hypothetical protein